MSETNSLENISNSKIKEEFTLKKQENNEKSNIFAKNSYSQDLDISDISKIKNKSDYTDTNDINKLKMLNDELFRENINLKSQIEEAELNYRVLEKLSNEISLELEEKNKLILHYNTLLTDFNLVSLNTLNKTAQNFIIDREYNFYNSINHRNRKKKKNSLNSNNNTNYIDLMHNRSSDLSRNSYNHSSIRKSNNDIYKHKKHASESSGLLEVNKGKAEKETKCDMNDEYQEANSVPYNINNSKSSFNILQSGNSHLKNSHWDINNRNIFFQSLMKSPNKTLSNNKKSSNTNNTKSSVNNNNASSKSNYKLHLQNKKNLSIINFNNLYNINNIKDKDNKEDNNAFTFRKDSANSDNLVNNNSNSINNHQSDNYKNPFSNNNKKLIERCFSSMQTYNKNENPMHSLITEEKYINSLQQKNNITNNNSLVINAEELSFVEEMISDLIISEVIAESSLKYSDFLSYFNLNSSVILSAINSSRLFNKKDISNCSSSNSVINISLLNNLFNYGNLSSSSRLISNNPHSISLIDEYINDAILVICKHILELYKKDSSLSNNTIDIKSIRNQINNIVNRFLNSKSNSFLMTVNKIKEDDSKNSTDSNLHDNNVLDLFSNIYYQTNSNDKNSIFSKYNSHNEEEIIKKKNNSTEKEARKTIGDKEILNSVFIPYFKKVSTKYNKRYNINTHKINDENKNSLNITNKQVSFKEPKINTVTNTHHSGNNGNQGNNINNNRHLITRVFNYINSISNNLNNPEDNINCDSSEITGSNILSMISDSNINDNSNITSESKLFLYNVYFKFNLKFRNYIFDVIKKNTEAIEKIIDKFIKENSYYNQSTNNSYLDLGSIKKDFSNINIETEMGVVYSPSNRFDLNVDNNIPNNTVNNNINANNYMQGINVKSMFMSFNDYSPIICDIDLFKDSFFEVNPFYNITIHNTASLDTSNKEDYLSRDTESIKITNNVNNHPLSNAIKPRAHNRNNTMFNNAQLLNKDSEKNNLSMLKNNNDSANFNLNTNLASEVPKLNYLLSSLLQNNNNAIYLNNYVKYNSIKELTLYELEPYTINSIISTIANNSSKNSLSKLTINNIHLLNDISLNKSNAQTQAKSKANSSQISDNLNFSYMKNTIKVKSTINSVKTNIGNTKTSFDNIVSNFFINKTFTYFAYLSNITHLDLSFSLLSDINISYLVKSIKNNYCLKTLNLNNCGLTSESGYYLIELFGLRVVNFNDSNLINSCFSSSIFNNFLNMNTLNDDKSSDSISSNIKSNASGNPNSTINRTHKSYNIASRIKSIFRNNNPSSNSKNEDSYTIPETNNEEDNNEYFVSNISNHTSTETVINSNTNYSHYANNAFKNNKDKIPEQNILQINTQLTSLINSKILENTYSPNSAVNYNAYKSIRNCKLINKPNTLESLNISNNKINGNGLFLLLHSIQKSELSSLSIQNNQLTTSDLNAISYLVMKSNLISLNISNQKIFGDANNNEESEKISSLGLALKASSSLKTLIMNDVQLTSDNCPYLLQHLNESKLEEVSLDNNQISEIGGVLFSNVIKFNNALKKVSLKNCGLNSNSLMCISHALETSKNLNLEKLILVDNQFDDKSLFNLKKIISKNEKLEVKY